MKTRRGLHYLERNATAVTPLGFAIQVLQLKDEFAVSVSSWGRTAKHNKRVDGHPRSKHKVWLAADFILDDYKRDHLGFKKRVNALGLGWSDEEDHIHVQARTLRK